MNCQHCNKPLHSEGDTLIDNTGGDVCGSYGTYTNEPHVIDPPFAAWQEAVAKGATTLSLAEWRMQTLRLNQAVPSYRYEFRLSVDVEAVTYDQARELLIDAIDEMDLNEYMVTPPEAGTEGQDRESYTDDQDRDEYTVDEEQEYDVVIRNTFTATDPQHAVRQMVEYLTAYLANAEYKVEQFNEGESEPAQEWWVSAS